MFVNIVDHTIKRKEFGDIEDLLTRAYLNTQNKRPREDVIQAYIELYLSRKVIPEWAWDFCLAILDISPEEAMLLSRYPGGVSSISEEEIPKCSTCSCPLVYATHRVPGQPNVRFCSKECAPVAIASKSNST